MRSLDTLFSTSRQAPVADLDAWWSRHAHVATTAI